MRYVKGFGKFWWDFIVGEDWRIAAGLALTLAAGALLASAEAVDDAVLMGVLQGRENVADDAQRFV